MAFHTHGTPGLNAPRDRSALLDAIDAVTALHQHGHSKVEPWAEGYKFSGHHCIEDGEQWPCETIEAITTALEVQS
jgi:hypothetical protein